MLQQPTQPLHTQISDRAVDTKPASRPTPMSPLSLSGIPGKAALIPAHFLQTLRDEPHRRSYSYPRRGRSSMPKQRRSGRRSHKNGDSPPLSPKLSPFLSINIRSTFCDAFMKRIHAWTTAKSLKDDMEHEYGVSAARLRIFYAGREWKNERIAMELHVSDGDNVYAVIGAGVTSGTISLFGDFLHDADRSCRTLVRECRSGFMRGLAPQLTLEGSGGVYLLRNAKKEVVALFKPEDEEPFAPNNPRGYTGTMGQSGFRRGVLSGEAASREIAAYLLDKDGFVGVPFTTKVEACHDKFYTAPHLMASENIDCENDHCRASEPGECDCPRSGASTQSRVKVGSLQQFVHYDDLAGDLAAQCFPVREVHKIGIMDLRILNVDRNDANILVCRRSRSEMVLVPIDHGYSFPRCLEVGWCDWVWLSWPQARLPFDDETLAYIAALDPEEDMKMIRSQLAINEVAMRNARITSMLLKIGAAKGLTLYDIASIVVRQDLDEPSLLEIAVAQTESLARPHAMPVLRRSCSDGGLRYMFGRQSCHESDGEESDCSTDNNACNGMAVEIDETAYWPVIKSLLHQLVDNCKRSRGGELKHPTLDNAGNSSASEEYGEIESL